MVILCHTVRYKSLEYISFFSLKLIVAFNALLNIVLSVLWHLGRMRRMHKQWLVPRIEKHVQPKVKPDLHPLIWERSTVYNFFRTSKKVKLGLMIARTMEIKTHYKGKRWRKGGTRIKPNQKNKKNLIDKIVKLWGLNSRPLIKKKQNGYARTLIHYATRTERAVILCTLTFL